MYEFDITLEKLKKTLKENIRYEDDKIYIKNKLKYDIYNLMCELDPHFIKELEKEYKVLN